MSVILDSKYISLLQPRLKNFKKKGDLLWNFSCPICGDSHKNKWKARGYVFKQKDHLVYKCHNCGATKSISGLLQVVDPNLKQEYVAEKFAESGNKRQFKFGNSQSLPSTVNKKPQFKKDSNKPKATPVLKLPKNHIARKYLSDRKIPEDKLSAVVYVENFSKFVNSHTDRYSHMKLPEDKRIVFPLIFDGSLIGLNARSLEKNSTLRYVTVKFVDIEYKVYNFDKVDKEKYHFVFEGPIDSLFVDNSYAVIGSNLHTFPRVNKNSILVLDNQPRNREIVRIYEQAIRKGCRVVLWSDVIVEKDINNMILAGELSKEELSDYLVNNSYSGAKALLEFNRWKKI